MYKQFPLTFVMTHFARATARGWDGSRLSHGALTFLTMWGLGVVSMQAKEIANGRDPLTLDPTEPAGLRAFGKALLQGGGLGVFGDFVALDQTRYGNSWATMLAGPQVGQLNLARFRLPAFDAVYERLTLLPDGPEREAAFLQAKRLAAAYAPYKAHLHQLVDTLAHRWVEGFRRPHFGYEWWSRVDIDTGKLGS